MEKLNREVAIKNAVLSALANGPAEWPAIVAAVKVAVPVRKNGWMEVRGVVGKLVESSVVDLDSDPYVERYSLSQAVR